MPAEHHQFRVEGMSCEHCRCRVQRALEAVPGVRSVSVELEKGGVSVEADEGVTSRDALVAAVEEVGYSVEGPNAS